MIFMKVDGCESCPFNHDDGDEFMTEFCCRANNNQEIPQDKHNRIIETPKWCPLSTSPIVVSINDYRTKKSK